MLNLKYTAKYGEEKIYKIPTPAYMFLINDQAPSYYKAVEHHKANGKIPSDYFKIYSDAITDANFMNDLFDPRVKKIGAGFICNEIDYTRRLNGNFLYTPHYSMIDIDLKTPTEKLQFAKDQKCATWQEARDSLLKKCKGDKHIWVAARSQGEGLRIMGWVVPFLIVRKENGIETASGLLIENEADFNVQLHKHNVKAFYDYLFKYGIVSGRKYIDVAAYKITQATYALRKDEYTYINPNPEPIIYKIKDNEIDSKLTRNEERYTGVEMEAVSKLNQIFVDKIASSDLSPAKSLFENYDYTLLGAIKSLSTSGRTLCYNLYDKYYQGTSVPLRDINIFNSFLNGLNYKYIISLEQLFNSCGIFAPIGDNKVMQDIFGNKFTHELVFKKYIQEYESELHSLLESDALHQIRIVLRAPAGAGKSTFCMNYLYKFWQQGLTVVFAAPNNGILEQKYEEYSNVKSWELVRNYSSNGNSLLINDELRCQNDNKFYLSSYQSLHKIKNIDILVLDECQNLINYSYFNDKQFNFEDTRKVLFVSATPEPLLIGLKDYKYINLKKEIFEKPEIMVCFTKQTVQRACQVILNNPNKSILVYYNDKERSSKLKTKFDAVNVHVELINSDLKDSPVYRKIVEDEIIDHGIYLATDLLNEGINLLNKDWDLIIILDNYTSSFLQFYQLRNRFRLAEPEIYLLMNGMPEDTSVNIPEDISSYLNCKYESVKKISMEYLNRIKNYPQERDKILKKADYIYIDDGVYNINKNQIKYDIYKEFIEDTRKRRSVYLRLLFYFFKIRIKFLDEDKKLSTLKLSPSKLKYIKNHNMIDLFFSIFQNKDEFLMNYTQADLDDILLNKKNYQLWYQRTHELTTLIGDTPVTPSDEEYKFDIDIVVSSEKTYQKHKMMLLNKKLKAQLKLDRSDNFQRFILTTIEDCVLICEKTNRLGKVYFSLDDVWDQIKEEDVIDHFKNKISLSIFISKNFSLKWKSSKSNGKILYYKIL